MKKAIAQFSQPLGSIALILSCLWGIITLQQKIIKPPTTPLTQADYLAQEAAEKLRLQMFKNLPALGFDNIMADWLYLQYIQYFGDSEARESIGYVLAPDYMTAVVERDPRFVDALLKLDAGTSIFAGDPQTSVASFEKSLAFTPPQLKGNFYPPYYLWVSKAVNELLFLGDAKAAQKSYLQAAAWADLHGTPEAQQTSQRVRRTAQFLQDRPNSKVAQIGAWTMVLSSTSDERTIKRAFAEIKALGGEISVSPDGKVNVRVPEGIE